ncbi:MAG: SWIM zinc finger domain-containing protein [Ruminococcus sp.]|nr:SWIM zinc finger domain-containing protein [Ruminococcus sp.]
MSTENTKASEIWNNKWTAEIHTTEYALKRIKSAQSAKLTPVKIDTTDLYGYFQGSHGRYETFLDYCPCGDFHRSKLPCKHIYRLAIELGLMNINVEHNINAIVTPQNEHLSLDKVIDMVEELSVDAQKELLEIASNVSSTHPSYLAEVNDSVIELINSGIIFDSEPENHTVKFGTKNEICELLNSENIPYDKKDKKEILEKLCIEHIPEKVKERFTEIFKIQLSPTLSTRQIHYYLHRKYDTESYIDGDGIWHKYPLLDTALPDDNITNQLIKRGYYSR